VAGLEYLIAGYLALGVEVTVVEEESGTEGRGVVTDISDENRVAIIRANWASVR